MELIQPVLSGNILNNDGYNDILEGIDRTICSLALTQFKNDIYGFTVPIDYNLYDRLCNYREVLLDKLMGCNCMSDEYTIYIISNIQKIIC